MAPFGTVVAQADHKCTRKHALIVNFRSVPENAHCMVLLRLRVRPKVEHGFAHDEHLVSEQQFDVC
jgi:hypothetical protein